MDIMLGLTTGLQFLMGWPIITYVVIISVLCTVMLGFVQIRYFIAAWRYMFAPSMEVATKGAELTPMQAFLGALNSNLGNGAIAGVATAVAVSAGGPGAAFWMLVMGLLLMSVRYAEVWLSTHFRPDVTDGSRIGGPMIYLKHLPGKSFLPYVYAIFCVFMGFGLAGMMQANSVAVVINAAWGVPKYIVGAASFLFVGYILLGGAHRIAKASELLVPIKVGLFLIGSLLVLGFNYANILPALSLIFKGAFQPLAMAGGVVGIGIQAAMQKGLMRTMQSTEAGLGTASILFGSTESKNPVPDSIMAMLSTVISTVFCFTTALCCVVTNVWSSSLEGTAMVSAAYQTVFGQWLGSAAVIFLSTTFAMGVWVAYAFITREAWLFVTKGKFLYVFMALFCLAPALGAISEVTLVWKIADYITAVMLVINMFAIIYFLPVIRQGLQSFAKKQQ